MDTIEMIAAVEQIVREKGIDREYMFEAIEAALAVAYKKNAALKGADIKVESFIRLVKGETATDDKSEISLLTRLMVAAGGGGSSEDGGTGGYAGNETSAGSGTPTAADYEGVGATSGNIKTKNGYTYTIAAYESGDVNVEIEYENGTLGIGGKADYLGAGAGGAGYIGGSASHSSNAGGGGGLSYVYTGSVINNATASKVFEFYEENIKNSNEIAKLYNFVDSTWENIEISNIQVLAGNSPDIPEPFAYAGDNNNGYARIKKID